MDYAEELRKNQFQHLGETIYLDNAGASLYPQYIIEKFSNQLKNEIITNPHTSTNIQQKINEIRKRILSFFSTNENEYKIIFTSGATEAIKIVGDYFPWKDESHFNYVSESHTSLVGVRQLAHKNGCKNIKCIDRQSLNELKLNDHLENDSLIGFPAMSNFCGFKYDLNLIHKIKSLDSKWNILLDVAAFVSTNQLDLSKYQPDFACLSFYKIFGFPTGLGALLVNKKSLNLLEKNYFGGGSIGGHLVHSMWYQAKSFEDFFEDGTLPFHQILSLEHGFYFLENSLPNGIETVSKNTFELASILYKQLKNLYHKNGQKLVEIYCSTQFDNFECQGGIINFNLLKSNGQHFGYNAFKRLAEIENVIVRTGCFCNVGACQYYLQISDKQSMEHFNNGHVCGDDLDLIDNQPIGSIRISFGIYSIPNDVDKIIQLLKRNFLNNETSSANIENNQLKVTSISLYPLKSAAPMKVQQWPMSENGLIYDRNWSLMKNEKCLTQKQLKTLCLIQPKIDLQLMTLTLSHPKSVQPLVVPIDIDDDNNVLKDSKICLGKVCNESIKAVSYGSKSTQWLEMITGEKEIELVKLIQRQSSVNVESFANVSPYLVINKSSIRKLSQQIITQKLNEKSLTDDQLIAQFRANIVVDQNNNVDINPFSEDLWQSIEFDNGAILINPKFCNRCSMISTDQQTGNQLKGISRALIKMPERRFTFGILFSLAPIKSNQSQSFVLRVGTKANINYKD